MPDNYVLWQIGQKYAPRTRKQLREFRRVAVAVPVFNYNVDADPNARTRPDCPGVLYRAGKPPKRKTLKVGGTATAELNIRFTLASDFKGGELTLIYHRFGADVDHIQLDGDMLAIQKGAGEGKLKRFRHVCGPMAKGAHVVTLTTHGGRGSGNAHYIDFLQLTADPAEAALVLPDVAITSIAYEGAEKGKEPDEYVEITNNGDTPADMSGWLLDAQQLDMGFTFPDGTVLQPGKSLRVYTNNVDAATGGFTFASDREVWNNAGDVGTLYTKEGHLISTYEYGQAGPGDGGDGENDPGSIFVSPVLDVADIAGSLRWFEALGWERSETFNIGGRIDDAADSDAAGAAYFATLRYGDAQIFLSLNTQGARCGAPVLAGSGDDVGNAWMVWWMSSPAALDALHKLAVAASVLIVAPPADKPWGQREMRIAHPDGHVIRVSATL